MYFQRLIRGGFLTGILALFLFASLAFTQTDEVRVDDVSQKPVETETQATETMIDPLINAEFELRIEQIQEDVQNRIAELQTSQDVARVEDREAALSSMQDIKRDAQISILEVRREQELARGNEEAAEKFGVAAEMLRNPAPRQAPDPATDEARFNQARSSEESSTR